MKVPETSTILETARSKIAVSNTKGCLSFLSENLKFLDLERPDFFRFRDEILHFQSRNSSLEIDRDRDFIQFSEYRTESSKLAKSVITSLTEIELCLSSYPVLEAPKTDDERYSSEVTIDKDFESTSEGETRELIESLGKTANINQEELSILRKQAGSIIIELALSAESIVKIKSLLKLGVVKELKAFKVLDLSWGWIENNGDFHVYLPKANLDGIDLRGKNLTRADLSGANLSNSNLSGVDLSNSNLNRTNLSKAILNGSNLGKVELKGAVLKGASLRGINLRKTNLKGADFTDADLRGADFTDADLRGADFTNADLRGADFTNADLRGADFANAKIETQLEELEFGNKTLIKRRLGESGFNSKIIYKSTNEVAFAAIFSETKYSSVKSKLDVNWLVMCYAGEPNSFEGLGIQAFRKNFNNYIDTNQPMHRFHFSPYAIDAIEKGISEIMKSPNYESSQFKDSIDISGGVDPDME